MGITLMILLAYAIPPHFLYRLDYPLFILLPFVTLPFAAYLLRFIWNEQDKHKFNAFLERTAQFMALYGFLFAVGIIVSQLI